MRAGAVLLGLAAQGLAGPGFAEGGPDAAELEAMSAAMARAGCVVTAANQQAVLKDAGLSEAEGAAVLDALIRDGRATRAGAREIRLEGCK